MGLTLEATRKGDAADFQMISELRQCGFDTWVNVLQIGAAAAWQVSLTAPLRKELESSRASKNSAAGFHKKEMVVGLVAPIQIQGLTGAGELFAIGRLVALRPPWRELSTLDEIEISRDIKQTAVLLRDSIRSSGRVCSDGMDEPDSVIDVPFVSSEGRLTSLLLQRNLPILPMSFPRRSGSSSQRVALALADSLVCLSTAGLFAVPSTESAPLAPMNSALSSNSGSAYRYRLGPGDQLSMTVFKMEGYEAKVEVLSDGTISLPRIGTIQVWGLTLEEARQTITDSYSKILRRPLVDLDLVSPRPIKVTVTGDVQTPGVFSLPAKGEGGWPPLWM